jgi:putative oxidoreductase
MEQLDFALSVVRLWVGLVMVMHGLNHGRNLDGTARWFGSVGFKHPKFNARLSSFGEILIGTSIATGFLTSAGAAGLGAIMFVAFWSIHRFAGFFVFHRPDEGYEYVVTLAIVGLALAVAGPGAWSIDNALGIADDLDGWVGGVIFGAGIVAGYVQTVFLWDRPKEENASG